MTKKNAILYAINVISNTESPDTNVIATLQKMVDALSVKHELSDEAKAKINEKRKAENRAMRSALMENVLPILRGVLTNTDGITAKELFETTKTSLPEGWTWQKVQGVLTHELKNEATVIEGTKKAPANRYFIAR